MSIAVCVVTYNDPHRLRLCLEGLRLQTEQGFELHICDDGTPPMVRLNNEDLAREYGATFHYLSSGDEFRAGQARNLAIRTTQADRILCVDGDCVLTSEVIAHHAAYGSEPVVVCGSRNHIPTYQVPQLTVEDVRQGLDRFVVARDTRFTHRGGPYSEFQAALAGGATLLDIKSHRLAWGFQMSFPSQLARQLGGFDESFVGYGGEDQEFALRLGKAGCRLIARMDLIAYHLDHPQRSGNWAARVERATRNPNLVRNLEPQDGSAQ